MYKNVKNYGTHTQKGKCLKMCASPFKNMGKIKLNKMEEAYRMLELEIVDAETSCSCKITCSKTICGVCWFKEWY